MKNRYCYLLLALAFALAACGTASDKTIEKHIEIVQEKLPINVPQMGFQLQDIAFDKDKRIVNYYIVSDKADIATDKNLEYLKKDRTQLKMIPSKCDPYLDDKVDADIGIKIHFFDASYSQEIIINVDPKIYKGNMSDDSDSGITIEYEEDKMGARSLILEHNNKSALAYKYIKYAELISRENVELSDDQLEDTYTRLSRSCKLITHEILEEEKEQFKASERAIAQISKIPRSEFQSPLLIAVDDKHFIYRIWTDDLTLRDIEKLNKDKEVKEKALENYRSLLHPFDLKLENIELEICDTNGEILFSAKLK